MEMKKLKMVQWLYAGVAHHKTNPIVMAVIKRVSLKDDHLVN